MGAFRTTRIRQGRASSCAVPEWKPADSAMR